MRGIAILLISGGLLLPAAAQSDGGYDFPSETAIRNCAIGAGIVLGLGCWGVAKLANSLESEVYEKIEKEKKAERQKRVTPKKFIKNRIEYLYPHLSPKEVKKRSKQVWNRMKEYLWPHGTYRDSIDRAFKELSPEWNRTQ